MYWNQFLHRNIALNTPEQWMYAFFTAAVSLCALHIFLHLLQKRLQIFSPHYNTFFHLKQLTLAALKRTWWPFECALALALAATFLNLPSSIESFLKSGFMIIAFIQIGLWASAVAECSLELPALTNGARHPNPAAKNILKFLIIAVIWIGIALICLDNLHINISALLAGVGVTGVAVALATQNIVSDLFASFSLLLDKPFEVGDFIVADDMSGTVERIGIKTTRIRSLSGEQLIFSNGDLIKNRLRNFKSLTERRVVFMFGVRYQTPPSVLEQIPSEIRTIIQSIAKTRFDRAHLFTMTDTFLRFEVVYFVLDPNYTLHMDIQQAIHLALYKRLNEMQVEIGLPYSAVSAKSS